MLSAPFIWRWNRAEVAPITCIAGKTDYTVSVPDFGWLERAWILFPAGGGSPVTVFNSINILSISNTANVTTAITNGNPLNFGFYLGQTISVQSVTNTAFNSYQNLIISNLGSTSITFSQTGPTGTSSGGVVFNLTTLPVPTITAAGAPLPTYELEVKETLAQVAIQQQPAFISVIADDNNGNITFRLMGCPDQSYTLYIIYQKAAPSFGSTVDTWAPIPDYMSYIYNLGFLAKVYEYKGDERFAFAHQEFLKLTVAASDGLTDSQKNIFLEPRIITAREQAGAAQTGQNAKQGRSGL
jgi:hypothetical protein